MQINGQPTQHMVDNFQQAMEACQPYLLHGGGHIPAMALGVITRDGDSIIHCMGTQDGDTNTPLQSHHYFDLASLTKAMFTAPQILRRVNPDDLYIQYMPEFQAHNPQSPLRQLTIGQLLSHTTPLPSLYPFDTVEEDLVDFAMQYDWPLGQPSYSCVGYILLGFLLHRLLGHSLLDINRSDLWGHAPADSLTFTPPPELCCPSEVVPSRGGKLQGVMLDPYSHAIAQTEQGVGGNSGLFGTINGVLGFIHQWLNDAILPAHWTENIEAYRGQTHALGWELYRLNWEGGNTCSKHTIGHLGYTGTGLWIDRHRGYGWTLLSNRTYPNSQIETHIVKLRTAIGNTIGANTM